VAEPEHVAGAAESADPTRGDAETIEHHSARTAWEFLDAHGVWRTLDAAKGEVVDHTRAFTLNGSVALRLPAAMGAAAIGSVGQPRYYLRCRLLSGAFDASPCVWACDVNAVPVEQAVPPVGSWQQPSANPQQLLIPVGSGTGSPGQVIDLPGAPLVATSLELFTSEATDADLCHWRRQDDFDASGPADAHYVLEPTAGRVTFGDGDRGRVVVAGRSIHARYLTMRAEAGNLARGTPLTIADRPWNQRQLGGTYESIAWLNNRLAMTTLADAVGGTAAESLEQASGRALETWERVERAVTLDDYRRLALGTPGATIARSQALANLHPAFPCYRAPGIVTVVIVPCLPTDRPAPSDGLRRHVAAFLARRSPLGTRVEVVGPIYHQVAIHATVRAVAGASLARVRSDVVDALDAFLHPLHGGPDGAGWPFGRDVFRSELMQVIDRVAGVDHVVDLATIADGGEPSCGDLCLGPLGLAVAGSHRIDVLRGER
jgi:predicted phage baseplate assembly protein